MPLSAVFFKMNFFKKFFPEYHQCQTGLIQIRPQILVGPNLCPSRLQRLSADDTSRQSVNTVLVNCSMVYMKSPPDPAENKGKKRKTDRRKSEAQRNLKLVQERR